jgi:hypothetical protein
MAQTIDFNASSFFLLPSSFFPLPSSFFLLPYALFHKKIGWTCATLPTSIILTLN